MSLVKITNQATQRIAAHFKPNTFFIHTMRPLPAILVPLPNRSSKNTKLIGLLRKLSNQEEFDFKEKLKSVQISKEDQSQEWKDSAAPKLTSVCGLNFDERTTFIACNQQGELILTKQIINPSEVLAVILYSSVQQSPVKAINPRNYENLLLLLRSTALLSILAVLRQLIYSTRLENHPSKP